ncbi:NAD-dependent epimerase/dehydratase family protein [Sphingomonas sp.]|uniref:NAD-dependent epimerase/dehydratase family protein n=1 Tax=Sphingomonas sp. TaxID=28214 RepID=UPI001801B4BE|nr:NAD-dependent epimerase/dehydratase family protein [Sphingomonas sp.]MBA3511195.1 GDP-mannose 4,6-dehydratase [Sphingomonas sp.]
MVIFVTGAAGFIGYHVSKALLARGEQILGVDNLNPYYDPGLKQARIAALEEEFGNAFTFLRADFADSAELASVVEGVDFERLVHLGAQVGVRYGLVNPASYVRSNGVGHLNILELARHRELKHLVYASSSSVYGSNTSLPFRVEDRTDRPISLYAATKKADELMSESYSSLFRLPMTGLRFFTVYGPWGRPDMAVWLFTKAILSGEPLDLFNGGAMRRDFTYIDDVVAGVLACLDSPPVDDQQEKPGGSVSPHAVYNIGNHRSEELMELIGILEENLGRKANTKVLPMQPGDVMDTFADISAIRNDHGFEPKTSIREGVPRFTQWYKRYHELD